MTTTCFHPLSAVDSHNESDLCYDISHPECTANTELWPTADSSSFESVKMNVMKTALKLAVQGLNLCMRRPLFNVQLFEQ